MNCVTPTIVPIGIVLMNNAYIQIGDRLIGRNQPCFIIAEAGVNHNGSLDMALQLVDIAIAAGADAVKFQKRELKNLYPAHLLNNPNSTIFICIFSTYLATAIS